MQWSLLTNIIAQEQAHSTFPLAGFCLPALRSQELSIILYLKSQALQIEYGDDVQQKTRDVCGATNCTGGPNLAVPPYLCALKLFSLKLVLDTDAT